MRLNSHRKIENTDRNTYPIRHCTYYISTYIVLHIFVMTVDYSDRVLSNQRRKHENQELFIYSTSASTEIKLSKRLKVQAHRETSVCFGEGGAAMLCADLH